LPSDDTRRRRPDITLARRKLGWEPTIPLREGLKKPLNIDEFVKSRISHGKVKSSSCKARKSDGRGNPPGCPILGAGGSASRPYLPQRTQDAAQSRSERDR